MNRALTLNETARLLGRSPSWLQEHRDRLHAAGFPRPIQPAAPYCWDAAQVYAWLDRDLPPRIRATAAAIRAAAAAFDGQATNQSVRDHAAQLDERFGV